MLKKARDDRETGQAGVYQIRIKGQLDRGWSEWFGDADILAVDGETWITSLMIDQAALHGLLKSIRDMGMPLLSVTLLPQAASEDGGLPGNQN